MALNLQKPDWVYFRGAIRPWEEAVLHISCEAVNRGLSVFEGIRCYRQIDGGRIGILALPRHFERLQRSARLLHIPFSKSYLEFEAACHELVRRLCRPEMDMWIRATLFVVEGHWGEGTVADLVLTGYQQMKEFPAPVKVGVSSWRRSSDVSLPPRVKSAANYQVGRLARIDGRNRGCDEMILLNHFGRVAEATGSCVVCVRNGIVVTPPPWEGALESITVQILQKLCLSLALEFQSRPVERTELYVAQELALVGTLSQITIVSSIDDFPLCSEGQVLNKLVARFKSAVRGDDPHPAVDLSLVP